MKFLRGMLCLTGSSWLDFGADPDHDADTGIFIVAKCGQR